MNKDTLGWKYIGYWRNSWPSSALRYDTVPVRCHLANGFTTHTFLHQILWPSSLRLFGFGNLPVQLASRSWSRTVIKLVKSCTRMTFLRAGALAIALSSLSLTLLPIPSTTIFVCLPPEITAFTCDAWVCKLQLLCFIIHYRHAVSATWMCLCLFLFLFFLSLTVPVAYVTTPGEYTSSL